MNKKFKSCISTGGRTKVPQLLQAINVTSNVKTGQLPQFVKSSVDYPLTTSIWAFTLVSTIVLQSTLGGWTIIG